MTGRMKTGIEGLDSLLDGGFLYHNAILIKGPPGSGKTTLGYQIIHNGIVEYDEPGLVVSFDQFPQQFHRDMKSYGWDVEGLVESGKLEMLFVSPEDLAPVAAHLDSMVIGRIQEAMERIGAKRILIDSLSHFARTTNDPMAQRTIMMNFLNEIKTMGLTPILTAEQGGQLADMVDHEEYVADCVIVLELSLRPDHPLPERTIEIRKARGQNHLGGRHPLKLSDRGVEIYPYRLPEPMVFDSEAARDLVHVRSGIAGLDRMLQGGYTAGSASLVAGVSGVYKTTVLAQFLKAGAEKGEPGLLISFEEPPNYFVQVMRQHGVDLEEAVKSGTLALWHRVPKACQLEELFFELRKEIKDRNVARVAIDSMNDFERCVHEQSRCKDYVIMFNDLLARHNATTLWTQQIERTKGSPIGDIRCLSQFDTVVYLGYVEIESQLRKVISILKRRGARSEGDLRAIESGASGLAVTEKFLGLEGILEGSPRGQYKKTIEELLQPVLSARDFLQMVRQAEMPAERRDALYDNIDALLQDLDMRLRERFGVDLEEDD